MSGKKQREQAANDAKLAEERKKPNGSDKENDAEATDVLGEREDADVIF